MNQHQLTWARLKYFIANALQIMILSEIIFLLPLILLFTMLPGVNLLMFGIGAAACVSILLNGVLNVSFGTTSLISLATGFGAYFIGASFLTAITSPFILPTLAALSVILPFSMLFAMSNTIDRFPESQPAPAQAVQQPQEHADENEHDAGLQQALAASLALSSSAQVSQLLDIQVALNVGNDGEVAVSFVPQLPFANNEQANDVEEQHGYVNAPALS